MIRAAFVGKGGAGKSSLAGTVARLLARAGHDVLALDSDPLPGLAYSLGIPVEDRPIPDDAVVEGPQGGPRWVLRPELDAVGFVERYAAWTGDGVRYLQFGNLWDGVWTLQRAQFAWSQVVRELPEDRFDIIGDLPGGTRQAMFGWARYAEVVAIVVEPSSKSVTTARRLLRLRDAAWGPRQLLVVANKVESRADAQRIERDLGTPVAACVPRDPAMLSAERAGSTPLDGAPAGDFVDGAMTVATAIRAAHGELEEVPA